MPGDHRDNNFDFLRMVAATSVVIGHCYVLAGRAAEEPLARLIGFDDFGGFGVAVFFVISGYLVTASFVRTPELPAFFINRALRILPALAAVLVLSAFGLGPWITGLPLDDYLAAPETWAYVVRNLLLYPVTYGLPGVFADVPYPSVVNGSLWTLRLEVTFYLMVAMLGRLGLLARAPVVALTALFAAGYGAALLAPTLVPGSMLLFARFGLLFSAGAALFVWRGALPWRGATAVAVLALAAALALPGTLTPLAANLALPVIVLAIALRPLPGIARWGRFGDFSYGIYVFAFPVQQLLLHVLGAVALPPGRFLVLTLVCVLPLAVLSWWLVERPALAAKPAARAWLARLGRPPAFRGSPG